MISDLWPPQNTTRASSKADVNVVISSTMIVQISYRFYATPTSRGAWMPRTRQLASPELPTSLVLPPTPAPEPSRPSHPPGAGEQGISCLLATGVDFGSVKHHTAVNITTDGRAVLFRSGIDDDGAETSLLSRFSARSCPHRHRARTYVPR